MPDYGLLSTGLSVKPESAIRDDLDAGCRAAFGPSVPLGPKTLLGEYNGIVAAAVAEVWELGQAVDASQDVDGATGASLEQLAALTGTRRDEATPSTVTLTLTGTLGTVITAGNRAESSTTDAAFETTEDAALGAVPAWATATGYAVGDYVTNPGDDATDRVWVCITPGTSDVSGDGPTGESDDFTDGTAHWRFVGEGTAKDDAEAQCIEDGPTVATSGDITEIGTPVGGWLGVMNLLDAELGTALETDAHLRLKREEELHADDATTGDAIREALLKPVSEGGAGATSATVFVNNSDAVDADGMPPHSVEALVRGGEDQDVFDIVYRHVAAGIATYGTEAGTSTDSEGVDHVVYFSRPEEIEIYVDVTLTYDPARYPTDGDDQVAAAIVAYGDAFPTGRDAVAVAIGAQAFTVAGVMDVPRSGSLGGTLIDDAPVPTGDATITVTRRQLAVFDTSRVTVDSTPGTP